MLVRPVSSSLSVLIRLFSQGYAPPPPSAAPPPPPPGEQPPPPPSDGSSAPGSAQVAPAPTDMDAYAAYWCVSYVSRTRVTLIENT